MNVCTACARWTLPDRSGRGFSALSDRNSQSRRESAPFRNSSPRLITKVKFAPLLLGVRNMEETKINFQLNDIE